MASIHLIDLTPDTRERVEAFILAAKAQGLDVSVVSTLRTCADQGTSTGPVDIGGGMTAKRAPGCRSWHVWGRAVDLALRVPSPERYKLLGELGESYGLVWGGRFRTNPDPVHFQYAPGLDIAKLCPDPTDCTGALKAAGTVAPPESSRILSAFAFVIGGTVGWIAWRRIRRI